MKFKTAMIACAALASPALAEGVKVEPGKWDITSSATAELWKQGQSQALPPQSGKMSICVQDSEPYFNPKTFAHAECEIADRKNEPQSMYYKMTCQKGPLEMVGGLSVDVSEDGKTATGIMNYTVGQRGAEPGNDDYTYIRMDMALQHAGACD